VVSFFLFKRLPKNALAELTGVFPSSSPSANTCVSTWLMGLPSGSAGALENLFQ
jgi:hypothetical protein